MGAGESKKEKVVPVDEMKIEHERFRHFVYHQQTDQLEIKMDMQTEKDYQNWVQQLKKMSQFEQKQTLLLPVKHQYVNKGLCGTAGTLKIFYENYPYLFQEQIDNRIEMNKHFEEEQLWYLLYSLASSSAEFGKINSKVGDVRPYNIFINEEGQIKIANLHSWPYQKTNFDKTAFEKTLTYLAPEQMRLIAKGVQESTVNKTTAESFSIGLTLLQSGLLFNARQLYSITNFTIDIQHLNRKISTWHNLEFKTDNDIHRRYSPLLRNVVAGLCNPDDRERLTSIQVEEMLRPYQNQVLNLRQFDQKSVRYPGKLEQRQESVHYQQRSNNISPNRPSPQHYHRDTNLQRHTQVVIPQQRVVISRPPELKINIPQSNQVQYISRPTSSHNSSPVKFARPVSSQSPPRQYALRPGSSHQYQGQYRNQQVKFNTRETVYLQEGHRVGGGQQIHRVGGRQQVHRIGGGHEVNIIGGGGHEGHQVGGRQQVHRIGGGHEGHQVGGKQYEIRPQPIPVVFHEQQFIKYASPAIYQQHDQRVDKTPNSGIEPFFNKYATLNQSNERQQVNSTANFRSTTPITGNSFSYNVTGSTLNQNSTNFNTRQWQLPVKVQSTTAQFNRPYASINTQVVTTSVGGPGQGSDFLRKIDEQLQASRKLFPTR